jgi:hypothetical protein
MTGSSRHPRAMWTLIEPIHAVSYFSAEPRAAFESAGLRGYWRGYFAGRAAPLGAVGAGPVIALFSGFAPPFVRRALPAVWSMITPDAALEARAAGAAAALRRLAPDESAADAVAAALERVIDGLDFAGRALGAANADLPRPDDPHARLWQATATLRERRGDGHVAALVGAGVAGPDILVLRSALDLPRDVLQPARGWGDDDWAGATDRLVARGLLDADGSITDPGRRLVADVEAVTDRAAAWTSLSSDEIVLIAQGLSPIAEACAAELPERTPIGDLRLWDVRADPDAAAVASPGVS